MKQGTVKYSEEFVTAIGLKKWYGIELQYDMDTEDPPFDKAKKIIAQAAGNNQIAIEASMPPGPPSVINIERTSEDRRIAKLVRDICSCTEFDGENGLKSYSTLATTCEEARMAYNAMSRKLAKK